MSVDGIDGISAAGATSAGLLRNDRVTGDEFLQLLVTQLTHQDPLEPLSSEDFMSQLAQFQSLEELMDINARNDQILASQQLAAASALIGKHVSGISGILGYMEGYVDRIYVDGDVVYLDVEGLLLRVDEVLEVSGGDSIIEE
ncbi:MAG: flagellar hook capping protein [Planctomycetes bacterium]|nr:flagellar hook capping protein [Planctomycetota bacterium]